MKRAVVVLFFNFLLLHYGFSRETLTSDEEEQERPGKFYPFDAFYHVEDKNWVERSLFYTVEEYRQEKFLMFIPNVFNQTDHKLCPLYKRDDVLNFVLLSPYKENLLVYGSVDDDNVNGTTWKSVKLVKVQFSNQCGYDDTDGHVPLNTTQLDAKLLSVVLYANANYSFYYVADSGRTVLTTFDSVKVRVRHEDSPYQVSAEAREFSVVPLRRGVADSGHLFIEKTLEMVKMTLINKYGKVQLLRSFRRTPIKGIYGRWSFERDNFDYSLEHDTIGLCYHVERTVICSQYDFLGQMKHEYKTIKLDQDLLELAMHNAPTKRGFLLMITLEEDEAVRNMSKYRVLEDKKRIRPPYTREKKRLIWRFDEKDEIAGTKTIDKFGCELDPAILKPRFIDQGNDSYCLTMICKDSLTFRSAAMGVAKSCFSIDQLKIPQITKK